MKKGILLSIVCCLCWVAQGQAQLQKGTNYMGATLALDGDNWRDKSRDRSGSNNLRISPQFQIAKFIGDHKMIGVGFGGSLKQNWGKSGWATTTRYRILDTEYVLSPYIRHYKTLSPKWALFLHTSLDLALLQQKVKAGDTSMKESGYSARISLVPGVSYWITPRFALESDINLLSLGIGYRDFQDSRSFNFNSAVTTALTSYFSVRASWYIKKH